MSELERLHEDQDHDHVHHRSVKLETEVGGTNVEYCTEDALENQTDAHAIEQAELLQQTS